MKFPLGTFASVFVICAMLNVNAQKAETKWTEFVLPDAGIKVSFPGIPKSVNKKALSERGAIDYVEASVGDRKTAYMVIAADHPINRNKSEEGIKRNYDELRDAGIARFNAKLVSERNVLIGEHLGREIAIAYSRQVGVIRYFDLEGIMVQLIAIRHESLKDDPATLKNVEQFLSSLQILGK